MKRALLSGVALIALVSQASAQSRQPAQMTTLPTTNPQEFDLLDKNGNWQTLSAMSGGSGIDVRSAGCVADGVTDQAACFTAALNAVAPACLYVPPTTLGFAVSAITVTGCLRGSVFMPGAFNSGFAGTSWLSCLGAAGTACLTQTAADQLHSPGTVENITLVGAPLTPNAGSIGYRMNGGYNVTTRNLAVYNFDDCMMFGPNPVFITSRNWNTMLARCQTHYVVNDGFPELDFFGGRFGANSTSTNSDFSNSQDFVYFTRSTNVGASAGPNSTLFEATQFNPIGGVACAFRWGGMTGTGGSNQQFHIVDSHVEWHTYTGAGVTQGFICTDSTVATLTDLWITNNTMFGVTTTDVFNVDPATAPIRWRVSGNNFVGGQTYLTFKGGTANAQSSFNDNLWSGATATWTGQAGSVLLLSHNKYPGQLTLTGTWGHLDVNQDYWASMVDTAATGEISVSSSQDGTPWTPVLNFVGGSAGLAYTVSDNNVERTPDGGFVARAKLVLTAKGSALGAASISGIPYTCSRNAGSSVVQFQLNMAGLTGAFLAQMSTASPATIFLNQQSATGVTQLNDSNFTNTSAFEVMVRCSRTL